jgi:hypothetical protein
MMKSIYFTLLGCAFIAGLLSFTMPTIEKPVKNNSFGLGEKVEYRIHYGIINAAEAKVEIAKSTTTIAGKPCFKIDVTGRTTGAFDLISKVRDNWRTHVDTLTLMPLIFYQKIQENKYRKEETVHFYRESGNATSKIKNETKSFKVPQDVHDIISSYYFLRTVNFDKTKEGEVIEVSVFFSNEVYKLRVRYAGRETIKTPFGKTKVFKLHPLIPDNKFFKGEGAMKIWVSDDINRIPVKVKVDLAIGSLQIDMKSFSGLKQDLQFF